MLSGKLQGHYALDITENVRLVLTGFDIAGKPSSEKAKIVEVMIEEVIDYHDK